MALKDNTGIRQGYAMVNVAQFNQIRVWAETLEECRALYIQALRDRNLDVTETAPPNTTPPTTGAGSASGRIADIRSAVVNGTTTFYIQLEGAATYYMITVAQSRAAVLLDRGDEVTITFDAAATGEIIAASSVAAGLVELADLPAGESADPVVPEEE